MPDYRYLTQDLLTGTFLNTDLPISDPSFARALCAPGSFTGTLTPRYVRVAPETVQPGKTAIYVERDGDLVWGGIIWRCKPQGPKWLIEASTFSSYLTRRHDIHGNLNARGPWVYADPTDVFRAIWAYAQEQPDGDLGVLVDATKSSAKLGTPAEPFKTPWWEAPNLGDVVDELTSADDGFDYLDAVAWSNDVSRTPVLIYPAVNVAAGKTVTISAGGTNASRVTDGATSDSTLYAGASTGSQSVQVDLGSPQTVDTVKVWRAFADGRTFFETKTEVSLDGTAWSTLWDARAAHGPNRITEITFDALTVLPPWFYNYFGSTPGIVTPGRGGTGKAAGITTTSASNPQGMTYQTPPGTAIPLGSPVRCGAWVKAPAGQRFMVTGQSLYTGTQLLTGADYEAASLPSTASAYGVATVAVGTPGRSGSQCFRATTTSTAGQGLIHMSPIGTTIPATKNVKCGAWVKIQAGRAMTMSGRYTTPSGTYLGEGKGSVNFTGTGDWQWVETAQWTHSADYRPGFQITSSGVTGLTIDVDDAGVYMTEQLGEGGGVTTYIGTGDWQWAETKEWTVTSHVEATFRPGIIVRMADGFAANGVALWMDEPSVTWRPADPETAGGHTLAMPARPIRYIRDWSNGSTTSTANQWIEVQAYSPNVYATPAGEPGVPVRRVKVGYPRLGRRRTDISFRTGANIQEAPPVEYDGDSYAQVVIGLGAGEGSARIQAIDAIRNTYPRLEHVEQQPAMKGTDQLAKFIRTERIARSSPASIGTIVVRDHQAAPIGSFDPGEDVFVEVHDDWTDLALWCRIVSYTVSPDTETGETIELDLARADSFHYGAPA